MIAKIGEKEVDWKDLIGGGSSPNACIRLEVHLINSKDAAIYLTCVPLSLEEVKELAERWECDILNFQVKLLQRWLPPQCTLLAEASPTTPLSC